MENKFKYADCWKRWNLKHKNINIEIGFREPRLGNEHFERDRGGWVYYLHLILDKIKNEELRNSIWLIPDRGEGKDFRIPQYNYYNCVLVNLPWHGGITYYEKKIIVDTDIRVVKVGCDYQHYCDEGRTYTKESVLSDAIETAEAFLEMCPDYAMGCNTSIDKTKLDIARLVLTRIAQEMDLAKKEHREFTSENVFDAQISIADNKITITFPKEIVDCDPDGWLNMDFET